jgi:PAS domain S-box-containing protein
MLGYEDHEIANHIDEWKQRVHPDDLDWVLQAVQKHFAQRTPFYIAEYRMQCKDSTYKWILDRGQALWDETGNVVRMVGSHSDINDRKLAEEKLKHQNQRSQLFAEITSENSSIFTTRGNSPNYCH